MKGSWKVGKFAGIGVYIHPTFLILVVWLLFVYWSIGHNLATVVSGLVFTAALFVCVVLHEFGHALTARRYGIGTRSITLLPIGGVSSLERIPEEPKQEFYVALMGPVVSLGIAAVLLGVLMLAGRPIALQQVLSTTSASFLARLMWANVILAVFNLLPAFPMDGGRIFRALLARYIGTPKATHIAAVTGHAIAVVFGLLGLYTNPFLLFIALFVWIGASQEVAMADMKSALAGVPVSQVTVTELELLSASETLGRAVELVLHGTQEDFPVIEGGRLVGILTNKDLLQGLSKEGAAGLVSEAMRRNCPSIDASASLQTAMEQLQSSGCQVLPVLDQDRLVGLFRAENLAEFVLVQSALKTPDGQSKTEGPIRLEADQERRPRLSA